MPELPDVIPGEVIAANTTNQGQRRMIQRYANSIDRDAENPTPETGDGSILTDTGEVFWWTGAAWTSGGFLKTDGTFPMTGALDMGASNITNLRSIQGTLNIETPPNGEADIRERSSGKYLLSFNLAGSDRLYIGSHEGSGGFKAGRIYSRPIWDNQGGGVANVAIDANGFLQVSSSARKYKSNIQPADLAHLQLEPVTYHHDGDDTDYIGFIADDMPIEEAIVRGPDGDVENYDLRAVVAILSAQVNALTARLEALES